MPPHPLPKHDSLWLKPNQLLLCPGRGAPSLCQAPPAGAWFGFPEGRQRVQAELRQELTVPLPRTAHSQVRTPGLAPALRTQLCLLFPLSG